MGMNENIELGYAMDPTAVYGPSTAGTIMSTSEEGEPEVIMHQPVEGAVGPGTEGAPTSRVNLSGIAKSPVGWLLILLVLAYIAFHRVYGNG